MDCVIPGHAVRNFCSSIACLSRIGKDLYVEFDSIEGLRLRSLNDTKSAYTCFSFEPSFFERCTAPTRRKRPGSDDSDAHFSCRVAIKALSSVIRNRKNVVSLRIMNESISSKLHLSFEFHVQSFGQTLVRILHRVPVAEVDSVSAVASKEDASQIQASPKLLLQLLGPLKKTDEAALFVRPDPFLSASSFQPSILVRSLTTETVASADEFELDYIRNRVVEPEMPVSINENVVLVFPLRESKAVLQYCTGQDLPVNIYFHWGSQPMIWTAQGDHHSVELVLATMDHKQLESLDPNGELQNRHTRQ